MKSVFDYRDPEELTRLGISARLHMGKPVEDFIFWSKVPEGDRPEVRKLWAAFQKSVIDNPGVTFMPSVT